MSKQVNALYEILKSRDEYFEKLFNDICEIKTIDKMLKDLDEVLSINICTHEIEEIRDKLFILKSKAFKELGHRVWDEMDKLDDEEQEES